MNDNLAHEEDELQEWVWEIVDKHDLGLRADSPLAAATVLMTDAGFLLSELSSTAFREQAMTTRTKEQLATIIDILSDAQRLATLCDEEPHAGHVSTDAEGTLTWAPLEV